MKTFRPHWPSPALVVAIVALVVALGGTSYAAFSLPKNSVGTNQLKNDAVTNAKIKNHAVTKAKLNLAGVVAPSAKNAEKLGGQPPSAYLGSNAVLHSGLVVVHPQHPGVVVLRSGPLSQPADCSVSLDVVEHTTATLHANSTDANWLASGVVQNAFSIVIGDRHGQRRSAVRHHEDLRPRDPKWGGAARSGHDG